MQGFLIELMSTRAYVSEDKLSVVCAFVCVCLRKHIITMPIQNGYLFPFLVTTMSLQTFTYFRLHLLQFGSVCHCERYNLKIYFMEIEQFVLKLFCMSQEYINIAVR